MRAFESGVSIDYPMYYDSPNSPLAYDTRFETQFRFGHEGLVVAPIVTKRNATSNLTALDVFVPAGRWVDVDTLRVYAAAADRVVLFERTQSERGALLVQEGTILPMTLEPRRRSASAASEEDALSDGRHPLLGGASELPRTLVWEAFLGNATQGSGVVVEDDAVGNAYAGGGAAAVATTAASFVVNSAGTTLTFTIAPTEGAFANMRPLRNYEIRLRGAWAPAAVSAALASGVEIDVAAHARPRKACGKVRCGDRCSDGGAPHGAPRAAFWWDAASLTASARVDDVAVTGAALAVTFTFATSLFSGALHSDAWGAALPTLSARAQWIKTAVDREYYRGTRTSRALNMLSTTVDRMELSPETARAELEGLVAGMAAVVALHCGSSAKPRPTRALQDVMCAWLVPPVNATK